VHEIGGDVTRYENGARQPLEMLAGGVNGFTVAHRALGSKVSYHVRDVHRLDPAEDGRFDLVLFVNVLYHLKNPVEALERLASVTNPGGQLVLKTYFRSDVRVWVKGRCVSVDLDRRPKFWFFPTTELAGDPTNWYAPNRVAVEGLLSRRRQPCGQRGPARLPAGAGRQRSGAGRRPAYWPHLCRRRG
jgi:SAM-dependent methyltransferase